MAKKQAVKVGPQGNPKARREQEKGWRKLLLEQSRSSLNQSEFCRRLSIPSHRFSWWKREIAIRDGKRPRAEKKKRPDSRRAGEKTSLVPVRIGTASGFAREFSPDSRFEIILKNKWTLRIPREFDGEALLRLIRLLEEKC